MNRRTRSNLMLVLCFTAISLTGMEWLAANLGQPLPFSTGYTLHADFPDAEGLVTQDEVRVSGVRVGEVTGVTADPLAAGETDVTITINNANAVPVYSNGSAAVEQKGLLGAMYVNLTPGTPTLGTAIASGGQVPLAAPPADVSDDQILDAFNAQTRSEEQALLQELNSATTGQQGNIQALLPALQAVSSNLNDVASTYSADSAEVNSTLLQLDTILATTADEHVQLAQLIDNGDTVVTAVASRDTALITTLSQASALANEVNTAAAPTVTQQRQTIAQLTPALSDTNAVINAIVGPQTACGGKSCGLAEIVSETLTGNINYPNDQLNITSPPGQAVANEWNSMFSMPATASSNGAQSHSSLNLVLAFHCDEVTQTLNEVLPGLSAAEQNALSAACTAITSGGSVLQAPVLLPPLSSVSPAPSTSPTNGLTAMSFLGGSA